MAVEYRLTLAGEIPVEQVAECALPDPAERPTSTDFPGVLSIGLYEERGFALSINSGRAGYYYAQNDDSPWEWEPDGYVNVTFRMGNDDRIEKGIPNMLAVAARVLADRREDAALVLNGELLLLTRLDGKIRKHNRALWWDHYGFVNEIIPG